MVIPQRIGENDFPDGYAAYLCADVPKIIAGNPFSWEDMVALYQQVEDIPQQAAHVQIALLDELIRWQVTLINT